MTNKVSFIQKEVKRNQENFGRWGSTKKVNSASVAALGTEESPKTEEEVVAFGNALSKAGNYPSGVDACFSVGISGGCGPSCFVFIAGECKES